MNEAVQSKKVLLLGANGQLGSAFLKLYQHNPKIELIQLTRNELDLEITNAKELTAFFKKISPDAVINTTAYTAVDLAESEKEKTFQLNATVPGFLAEASQRVKALLIHFSTDYVFDGQGNKPRRESDATHPINVYGESKREGEKAILKKTENALIFRTSWLYSLAGKSFYVKMKSLFETREEVKVIDDQWGAPTFAPDLAKWVDHALQTHLTQKKRIENPLLHLTHAGETTWHEFATLIYHQLVSQGAKLKSKVPLPVPTSDFPTPAKRPHNSRLNCSLFETTYDLKLPHWKTGLSQLPKETR